MLTVSLDLLVGHTGLLSLAQAASCGIGAYVSALLTISIGASFSIGMLTGMLISGMISLLISLPSVRLKEDYFAIASFGFQIIIYTVLYNWEDLTHGPLGIMNIPRPVIFNIAIQSKSLYFLMTLVCCCLAYGIVYLLSGGAFGRILRAIREDELFAQSLGKNTLKYKVLVFAISGALAALAGSLYAHYVTYIDPTSFTLNESILVVSMLIIGGASSKWGPLLGSVILVVLPEVLRFIGLSSTMAANMRQIFYGSLLVIMMLYRPQGLLGRYRFER